MTKDASSEEDKEGEGNLPTDVDDFADGASDVEAQHVDGLLKYLADSNQNFESYSLADSYKVEDCLDI